MSVRYGDILIARVAVVKQIRIYLVEQTNQQIWDEILRLVHTMKGQKAALDTFNMAVARVIPLDESCLPINYVSDAIILVDLVGRLETRGARPN